MQCHRAILAGEMDGGDYKADHVARWKSNIRHFVHVPTLTGAEARFQRSWFVDFVQNPHDLRPQLEAEMPPMPIGPSDAEALADQLGLVDRPATQITGQAERGKDLLNERGCTTCHAFSGAVTRHPSSPRVPVSPAALALAPDLAHTRNRMAPSVVDAWLSDPSGVKADSEMPHIPLSADERSDLVAALFTLPVASSPGGVVPELLPVLERPVAYAEVEARVFKKVCWHCHSNPIPTGGEGGPGNTGGFGFTGAGLDLGSREAVLRGKVDAGGGRKSVVEADAGLPRLVRHLHARYHEIAGKRVPGVRGMPMALPAVPLEDIQLVHSWIAQGTPP